jgi:hypothetical protein
VTFPPAHLIEAHAAGELDPGGTVQLVQHLVNCGLAWKFRAWRALADDLIARGLVTPPATRKGTPCRTGT